MWKASCTVYDLLATTSSAGAQDMNGVIEQGRADVGMPAAELAASEAPAQAAAAHAPIEPIHPPGKETHTPPANN